MKNKYSSNWEEEQELLARHGMGFFAIGNWK